jgi:hypothetical protein
MPNGTYGGVRGWGREAPAYSIFERLLAKHGIDGLAFPKEKILRKLLDKESSLE